MRLRNVDFSLKAGVVVAFVLAVAGLPIDSASATPSTYFVSPGGNDSNSGSSTASPFETIQHCADVAQPGDTCRIMSGTYRETVTPPTSGTNTSPITFVANGDGAVTVDGADPVSTSWSAVTSGDLAALQSADPRLTSAPIAGAVSNGNLFQTTVTLDPNLSTGQLFLDGKMANIAQWPDSGSDLSHPVLARAQSASESGLSGTINDPNLTQPAGYWNGTKAWVNAWFVSQTATVSSSTTGQFVMNTMGCETISHTRCGALGYAQGHGTRYRLYGSLEAMSAPGQWLYSSSDHKLYLWLKAGDTPGAHTIKAKARGKAFDLSNASYITVRGLSMFASTIVTGSTTTGNVIDAIDAKYVSHYTDLVSESNLLYNTGYNVITAGELSSGIQLRGTGNTLRNSSIAYSAGNGVLLEGTGNTVVGNYIHETDYMGSYAGGINLTGTGQSIMYNTVFNSGRSALNIDDHVNGSNSQNNRIAYNDFSAVGALSTDLGLMYMCCDLDMTGTRIDHNWVHDDDASSQTQGGIFFDCGAGAHTATRGAQADHNAIWNMSLRSFVINGGTNIGLINNTYTQSVLPQNYCGHNYDYSSVNDLLTSQVPSTEFVNPWTNDYRLAPGATSIDSGTVNAPVTDGYMGSSPDKGANEYNGQNWIAGCTWGPCWTGKTGVDGETATYEAEDASLTSMTTASGQVGWSGSGYAQVGTTSSTASFAVTASQAGTRTLRLRYAAPHAGSPGVNRTLSLYVNGTKSGQLTFPSTPTASDWATVPVDVALNAGSNSIDLRVDSGDSGDLNLDSIALTTPVLRPARERIEAEDYTAQNSTNKYSGGGTGTFVGNISSSSWLEYNHVDFGTTGLNSFQASVASPSSSGRQLQIRLDSRTGTVIGTLTITGTGGWYNFATQTAPITTTTGVHDVYLVPVGTGLSGYGNVDWITFGNRASERIEAEGYTSQNDTSQDSGGTGTVVSDIVSSSWLEYANVDFGASGLTLLQANVAVDPAAAGKQIEARLDSRTGTVIGTLTTTSTGGWSTFATESASITSTTGVHDVYLVPVGTGLSDYAKIDWIKFGTPGTGTIQSEAYTAQNSTSLYSGGTGTFVGNISSSSWLKYGAVDFGSAGLTSFQASVASPSSLGRQLQIRLDSLTGTVIGTLTVTSTGGWYTFATQTATITATTGVHDVYLVPVGTGLSGYANIDWLKFL
jgi:hypothetical protein